MERIDQVSESNDDSSVRCEDARRPFRSWHENDSSYRKQRAISSRNFCTHLLKLLTGLIKGEDVKKNYRW